MILIDDVIVGMIKGLKTVPDASEKSIFDYINYQVFNSWKIWSGLFQGKIKLIVSRFTWEILQTILGFFAAHFALFLRPVSRVGHIDGVTVLEGGGWGGSMSLGTYIFLKSGNKAEKGEFLYMHEFGHSIQSMNSGPLYLFKYGIPSLLTPNNAWMERDANYLAQDYFEKHYSIFKESWQSTRFNETNLSKVKSKWWEYLLLIMVIGIIILPILNLKKPL